MVGNQRESPEYFHALERLTYDDLACREFTTWAGEWRSQQRELVLDAMRLWSHESQYWETVFVALGGEVTEVCLDPVPTGWPEEWRWAVELFRQDGDLQLLRWAMDQKPADYGPLLAVLELDHGPNWRGIRRLIDLFLSSRERMRLIPGFVAGPGGATPRTSRPCPAIVGTGSAGCYRTSVRPV